MKALILTGGFGTRLKEVIHDRPKVMAGIANKPFLEFVLENLAKNRIGDVVVSIGYLGSYIKNYFEDGAKFGIKISYSEESRPLGTGGAVKLAEKFFAGPFLVINGDTLVKTNFLKLLDFHLKKKAVVTIGLVKKKLVSELGVVKLNSSGKITVFLEKPKNGENGLVNCGVYVFNPGVTRIVKNKKRFSLEKDLFPKLAAKGRLYGYRVDQDFIDIGTPAGYYKALKMLAERNRK